MKKLLGGGMLIFTGAFMLLGFTINLSEKGGAANIGDLVAIVLFVVAPIALGFGLVRSHFTSKRKIHETHQKFLYTQQEKQIIRLAQQKGGRLTIPEIAVDTSLNTEEAEAFMQQLAAKGYVNMDVTDAGVIVYEFYEIAHHRKLSE